MALPPHASAWMDRAEIDYIGPFVKAWAAFNAWFRHASGHTQERAMLNFALSDANSRLRRRGLPLLEAENQTAEAAALKQAIFDLHLKLDAIHLEVTKKGQTERISLRAVCISPRSLQNEHTVSYGYTYRAARVAGGSIELTVTNQQGIVRFQHVQDRYAPALVYELASFTTNLSVAQRQTFRQFYESCNPRPMRDLVQGGGPNLQVAAMEFQCTPEDLLSGVVETIYSMRNALFHGEVDLDEQVLACYEPAYRIVICFLRLIE